MADFKQIVKQLEASEQFSRERRSEVVEAMRSNENSGLACYDCEGTCCTFRANSMMVTPLEGLEVYLYLVREARFENELPAIEDCIQNYRLDYDLFMGRGREVRRTYTCPFFSGEKLGCQISVAVKPYGCLAFNPRKKGITEGGDCSSMVDVLERRDQAHGQTEELYDRIIKEELGLDWAKKSLPVALVEIHQRYRNEIN